VIIATGEDAGIVGAYDATKRLWRVSAYGEDGRRLWRAYHRNLGVAVADLRVGIHAQLFREERKRLLGVSRITEVAR
jgi:hypothetical protein